MTSTELASLQRDHVRTLQQRYEALLAGSDYDAVLISSGTAPLHYGDDQRHHHRGFPAFVHWTSLAGLEHGWLLIEPGRQPRLWLHTPVDFWHATPELPGSPWQELFEIQGRTSTAAPELPGMPRLAVVGDPAVVAAALGDINPPDLLAAMEATRVHKTPYEIACLAEASATAAAGHRAAVAAFASGASEFEISLAFQAATGQREVDAPYHSIIGLNEHAAVLHYQHYELAAPERHRSLLIDAGARVRGYGSDITRTTAGEGEGALAALIEGIERLQRRLWQAAAPGADFIELHHKAHLGLAALLSASGLVKGLSGEAMVAEGVTGRFFPHGLGHLLGVQVHDVAGKPRPAPAEFPMLRLTRVLEPAMVLTIEPGLYFIPSLLEPLRAGRLGRHLDGRLLAELQGCGGIRIEDNIVVTETGPRNLTREWL